MEWVIQHSIYMKSTVAVAGTEMLVGAVHPCIDQGQACINASLVRSVNTLPSVLWPTLPGHTLTKPLSKDELW